MKHLARLDFLTHGLWSCRAWALLVALATAALAWPLLQP